VLLAFLLIRPVVALTRRHHRTARPPTSRAARTADARTTGAAACAVLAAIGWGVVLGRVLGLDDVPDPVLFGLQGLQGAALVGVVPAAIGLALAARRRVGRGRVVVRLLLLLALVGSPGSRPRSTWSDRACPTERVPVRVGAVRRGTGLATSVAARATARRRRERRRRGW
jgi:hypothetical protein